MIDGKLQAHTTSKYFEFVFDFIMNYDFKKKCLTIALLFRAVLDDFDDLLSCHLLSQLMKTLDNI